MSKLWPNAEGCLSQMAEGICYEKLEEDLTCLVCLELYADPLMMPCSHSVCKACLQDIMKSRERAGKHDLECPACRETHRLTSEQVQALPKNLALENIVFRYQEIRSGCLSRAARRESSASPQLLPTSPGFHPAQSPHSLTADTSIDQESVFDDSFEEKLYCGMCEERDKKEASWFCPQCQVLYCQVCLDLFHPRRGSLGKHKIRRPAGIENSVRDLSLLYCLDHYDQRASIFCDSCKVVVCHLCVCTGHGAHCSHTIIDLETAGRQLQETVQMAHEKLSVLMETFSHRELEIAAHLRNIKDLEERVKSSITSQHTSLLSDLTSALDLAKKMSLDRVSFLSGQKSSQLLSQSIHVRTLLSDCEELTQACQGLLSVDNKVEDCQSGNQSIDSSFNSSFGHEKEELRRDSREKNVTTEGLIREGSSIPNDVTPRENSPQSHRHSSSSSDTVTLPEGPVRYHAASPPSSREAKASGAYKSPKRETICSDSDKHPPTNLQLYGEESAGSAFVSGPIEAADGDATVTNKTKTRVKSASEIGASSPPLKQTPRSLSSESKTKHKVLHKGRTTGALAGIEVDRRQSSFDEESVRSGNSTRLGLGQAQTERRLDISVARKLATDRMNSERKLSALQLDTQRQDDSFSSSRTSNSECLGIDNKELDQHLLLKADQVGPVLDKVTALSKRALEDQSCKENASGENSTDHDKKLTLCVSAFHRSSLNMIHSMTALPTLIDCPAITPSVRSVSVSSPHHDSCMSRVQSRVLLTWGFNSTTFTADPVTSAAQWTVNINRNMSHIGDVKSGYLFGVGVSLQPLTSKEQVGMSHNSHAVVCVNGNLALCQDKQVSPIMPLSDLPLSVTLSVGQVPSGDLLMAYIVRVNGLTRALHGRRVVKVAALGENDLSSHCEVNSQAAQVTKYDDDRDSPNLCSSGDFYSLDDTVGESGNEAVSSGTPVTELISGKDAFSPRVFSIHPVFTVSQRVKMQFPHTSDV